MIIFNVRILIPQGIGGVVADEGASGEADWRSSRDDSEGEGHQAEFEEGTGSVWKRLFCCCVDILFTYYWLF